MSNEKRPSVRWRGWTLFLILAGVLLGAAGCGGGSHSASSGDGSRGAAQFTIQWPEPGARLVPVTTASIRITLSRDEQTLAEQVVARPPAGQNTSTVSLPGIVAGDVVATAIAFPNADATGTPLASGAIGITIVADRTTPATLTMNSTIARVAFSPAAPTIVRGSSLALTATALDASGAVVLTDPNSWSWISDNDKVASVLPSGNPTTVTGVGDGTSNLTATERESGQSGTVTGTVVAPVAVAIRPPTATVPLGGRQVFAADVTGTTNTAVTWSIQEGTSGGAIDTDGVYVAPNVAGVYHVVATSVADPTKSAVATVAVPVSVTIAPTSAFVFLGGQAQFTATVRGATDTRVFWSLQEGPIAGTIDSSGLYRPANSTGTFTIIATSVADPSQRATATVQVVAPPG